MIEIITKLYKNSSFFIEKEQIRLNKHKNDKEQDINDTPKWLWINWFTKWNDCFKFISWLRCQYLCLHQQYHSDWFKFQNKIEQNPPNHLSPKFTIITQLMRMTFRQMVSWADAFDRHQCRNLFISTCWHFLFYVCQENHIFVAKITSHTQKITSCTQSSVWNVIVQNIC